ncbi:hypothetical protein C4B63_19g38 [Trypanosoma cruzi]|uniref:Uncharacterized protein n=1 Tax=Trypanosoma cruzi TaxID=5693 RepID=A0A2V2VIG7_TRYCR|nr:hypothetical protein C4B63_19g38 [Trypanosoma cruzi]
MIVTGTNLVQCVKAIRLCRRYPSQLLCTVGIHPAHCAEMVLPMDWARVEEAADDDVSIQVPQPPSSVVDTTANCQYTEDRLKKLVELIEENRDVVVAVGEIGLDYAELSYCPEKSNKNILFDNFVLFVRCACHFSFIHATVARTLCKSLRRNDENGQAIFPSWVWCIVSEDPLKNSNDSWR